MILDGYDLFEPLTGTAITATGFSTNTLDMLNPRDMGIGEEELRVWVYQTAVFNNLTSINIAIQTSPDNSTWTTAAESGAITLAQLTAQGIGRLMLLDIPHRPPGGGSTMPRYYRLYYTIVGTAPTAGALSAGLAIDSQAAPAYPSGITVYN